MPGILEDALNKGTKRKLYYYKANGEWLDYSYQDLKNIIPVLGLGLEKLGLNRYDKIAILSENKPEWCFFDWTSAHFNFVSVPIYQTSIPKQIEYILNHSEAKVLVVSTKEQLEKIIKIKDKLEHLKHVVMLDNMEYDLDWVTTYEELKKSGQKEQLKRNVTLSELAEKIEANDLWSIIYTSGTSGLPKGVMITQFNIAANIQQTGAYAKFKPNKRWLSFLPLSHSFERLSSVYALWVGAEFYFAESIIKVPDNLKEVRPQYMTTVPRLLEKIYATVIEQVLAGPKAKQEIFNWAQRIGHRTANKYLIYNKKPLGPLALKYSWAKKLVFNKISAIFGSEFERCISGGAPLAPEIGEFFLMAGIRVQEGFGLTEMSPITHGNSMEHIKFGFVGLPYPDVKTKIAEDGEILLKGPNLMKGYYKDPEETAETIDSDGWFHTGDIGFVDEDGYLKITDRKKNLIVTAGGKNIAPAGVEREICSSKYIEQAVVIGDRQKYLVTILVPALEIIQEWGKKQNPPLIFKTYKDMASSKEVEKLIQDELDAHQEDLARYEQIKRFFIAPQAFAIETGELTASLKIKRNVVINKYSQEIDNMYNN
ncbi:MAG: long-chain fatty acid--CoA ligase [Candidatus Neomarinimicrobiota bacterium]